LIENLSDLQVIEIIVGSLGRLKIIII